MTVEAKVTTVTIGGPIEQARIGAGKTLGLSEIEVRRESSIDVFP